MKKEMSLRPPEDIFFFLFHKNKQVTFFKKKKIFIWLCWVLVAAHGIYSWGMQDLVP